MYIYIVYIYCIYELIVIQSRLYYVYIHAFLEFMYMYTLLQEHNDILGMLEYPSHVYGKPQEHVLNI